MVSREARQTPRLFFMPAFRWVSRGEVSQRRLDRAMERWVGVDHRLQRGRWDLPVNRHDECREHFTAARADRRGTDEHPSVRVLDNLDESVVPGAVDEATGRV